MDCCNVSSEPHCKQKQTDMGKVGIAIGMPLFSNLDDANHGKEHNKMPKPAGERVRSSPPINDRCRSGGKQESDRENDLPNCQSIIRMRIKNGEVCRP